METIHTQTTEIVYPGFLAELSAMNCNGNSICCLPPPTRYSNQVWIAIEIDNVSYILALAYFHSHTHHKHAAESNSMSSQKLVVWYTHFLLSLFLLCVTPLCSLLSMVVWLFHCLSNGMLSNMSFRRWISWFLLAAQHTHTRVEMRRNAEAASECREHRRRSTITMDRQRGGGP